MEREKFIEAWRRRQAIQAEEARLEAARDYVARLSASDADAIRMQILRGWNAPRKGAE